MKIFILLLLLPFFSTAQYFTGDKYLDVYSTLLSSPDGITDLEVHDLNDSTKNIVFEWTGLDIATEIVFINHICTVTYIEPLTIHAYLQFATFLDEQTYHEEYTKRIVKIRAGIWKVYVRNRYWSIKEIQKSGRIFFEIK